MATSIDEGSDKDFSSSKMDDTVDDTVREKSTYKSGRLASTLALLREQQNAEREINSEAMDLQADQLALLLEDLDEVIDELGDDRQHFDFRLSDHEVPQLWIDDVSFVVMAKDAECFRLLKETRAGRILLRESFGRKAMAEAVVHYVAERLSHIEDRRIQTGGFASFNRNAYIRPQEPLPQDMAYENVMRKVEPHIIVRSSPLRSFIWFLIGTLTGALTILALAWFRDDISAFLSVA